MGQSLIVALELRRVQRIFVLSNKRINELSTSSFTRIRRVSLVQELINTNKPVVGVSVSNESGNGKAPSLRWKYSEE